MQRHTCWIKPIHSRILLRQVLSKMAAAKHAHSQAGTACSLHKPTKAIEKPPISPPKCCLTGFVILYLLLCMVRPWFMTKNCEQVYRTAKGSQHLLFLSLMDKGRTGPQTHHEQTNTPRPLLGLFHLTVILLLAGDIETNPGPLPMDTHSLDTTNLAAQQRGYQHS